MFKICGCWDGRVIKDWIKVMVVMNGRPVHISDIVDKTGFDENYVNTILHILNNASLLVHEKNLWYTELSDLGVSLLKEYESYNDQSNMI